MIDYSEENLISFHAAAKRLAVSRKDLIGLVAQGSIRRPVRIGENLNFFASDIDSFIGCLYRNRQGQSQESIFDEL